MNKGLERARDAGCVFLSMGAQIAKIIRKIMERTEKGKNRKESSRGRARQVEAACGRAGAEHADIIVLHTQPASGCPGRIVRVRVCVCACACARVCVLLAREIKSAARPTCSFESKRADVLPCSVLFGLDCYRHAKIFRRRTHTVATKTKTTPTGRDGTGLSRKRKRTLVLHHPSILLPSRSEEFSCTCR